MNDVRRTPTWVQIVFLALCALFGQGCGARTIGRASGTVVDAARLHNTAQLPVQRATSAERRAYMESFVLTAVNSGDCEERDNLTIEAAFNVCFNEVHRASVLRYVTLACVAGCADRALQRTCVERWLPTLSIGRANGDLSAFGQTYTCTQTVQAVTRELSGGYALSQLEQARTTRELEATRTDLRTAEQQRDEALAALAARRGGAAPTEPADSAPLAGTPEAANRGDTHHANARHERRYRGGERRALRDNRPAPTRVRGRRENERVVCMGSRALDDAIIAAVQNANAPLQDQLNRVQRRVELTSATIAQLCPTIDVTAPDGWERCTRALHADLNRRSRSSTDAGVRAVSSAIPIATDAGTPPQARVTPQLRDARSPGVGPPSAQRSWGRQWLTRNRGVVLIVVLFIAAIILLRKVLPGTRGPAG